MTQIVWYKSKKEEAIIDVLSKMAEGNSLRSILDATRDKEKLPSRSEFNKWLIDDENLQDQYARACEERQDKIFEDMLTIADTPKEGETIKTDPKGKETVEKGDMLGHRKLQIGTRQWLLGKMNPKKYGDRIHQDININLDQPLFPEPDEKDK